MKSKGWEEIEAYGFMTTDARRAGEDLPFDKAMPVILTDAGGVGSLAERRALGRGETPAAAPRPKAS